MKKICYIVTVPITIRAFFVSQLKYLAEYGLEVHVICSSDDELQELLGERVKYIPLDMPRGINIIGTLKAIVGLIKVIKKKKYDLVQYSTPNAAFNAAIASKLCGVKVRNYHLMGLRYEGECGIKRKILKIMEKIACKLSTHIECVSDSNMQIALTDKLFPPEKVVVVWNGSTGGVDTSRFDYLKRAKWREEVRKTLGYEEDDFVYGFVGRITRDKGINDLLSAYNMLNVNDKLLFVGKMEGEETLDGELLNCARNNDNIQFHPEVRDIERFYAALDVLILPSHREGFGNVVIEAGAVGVPAIVSEIAGPVDTIEKDKTAYTYEVRNVYELAEMMRKIRMSDYRKMGENAAIFVTSNFDSNILNEKILLRKRDLLEH